LREVLDNKAEALENAPKTGRTHLMDAMPVTFGQELKTWSAQIESNIKRVRSALKRVRQLPQGGTAVGTGINAHAEFGERMAKALSDRTGHKLRSAENKFESISAQDATVELSGQLKTLACSLMKISNDLRLMNSGPLAGIGEIELPALQPGSSIMPGKVNPVIPEAVCMVCAQVIGNDTTITVAGQSGLFQLNVMLPVMALNIIQSLEILSTASRLLGDSAIAGFTVNEERIRQALERNPILVTALNPVIGYELGAATAKQAYREGRSIKEVALENTDLSEEDLDRLLDPLELTRGGIKK
jgi:fumarate hydratase class II